VAEVERIGRLRDSVAERRSASGSHGIGSRRQSRR
jgi:hypothetical protein